MLNPGRAWPARSLKSRTASSTSDRDGTRQVTYAGHPLYTYVADKKPGEANGNDFSSFGAQWYALHANGEEAGS